jgi:hypothetical protein
LLFDGLQWQPLTKDKMHCNELKIALEEVYPAEIEQLKHKGRELMF